MATQTQTLTDRELAKKVFQTVQDLDGYGLVTTDDDLLAERIGELFGVEPADVYDEYGGDASDRDDEDVEPAGSPHPWPQEAIYAAWPRFDVTLKGWRRVFTYNTDSDDFPAGIEMPTEDLVKWVIAPEEAIVAKWIADNGLTPYVESIELLEGRDDIVAGNGLDLILDADGRVAGNSLDLILDADGRVVGGDPGVVPKWKAQAGDVARRMGEKNVVPVYANHYRCPKCGDEWEDTCAGQPDDDCGECGTRHVTPHKSDEVAGLAPEEA